MWRLCGRMRWTLAASACSQAATITRSRWTTSVSRCRTELMSQALTRRAFLALGAVALGAVGGLAGIAVAQPSRDRPGDQRIAIGTFTLNVSADPWRMTLLGPDGQSLWEEAPDQTLGYRTADGRVRRARRLASVNVVSTDVAQLVAETDDPAGGALSLEVRSLLPGAMRITLIPDTPEQIASMLGGFVASSDEHFVGLGERFDGVDQRGRAVEMWAEDRRVAGYGPSTYTPIPLVMSSRGHAFALERFERSRFDLAASQPDRWSWQQDAPAASILVTYGPTLKDLIQRSALLVGLPPLPPMWLFGVWKTSVGGQDRVIAEMQRLRDLRVPVSAVFSYDAVDSDANLGWPSVTFAGREAGPYPDPRGYTDTLHGLGFKVLNYLTADFHTDRPNFQEPASHGFPLRRQDGRDYIHPNFQVSWLDYTDPDASVWWRAATWRRALAELGYDGGML